MSLDDHLAQEDVRFVVISFFLCGLAALTEALHQPHTWVAADVWNSGELSIPHLTLAALSVASCVYWLMPPGLYGGVLGAPSLLLIAITTLAAFAGLPHLLLWVLVLHHLPDVLLGLVRLALPRGSPASSVQLALAGIGLLLLLPLWFLCRMYWYAQLLNPKLLKLLPDQVVVIGLVLHVLLCLLGLVNLKHFWHLIRYCWRYLSGELEDLGDPFEAPSRHDIPEPHHPDDAREERHGHRAQFNKHQHNMQVIYHTIRTMTRLKRKIRRRRAEKAAALAAGASPTEGATAFSAVDGDVASPTR